MHFFKRFGKTREVTNSPREGQRGDEEQRNNGSNFDQRADHYMRNYRGVPNTSTSRDTSNSLSQPPPEIQPNMHQQEYENIRNPKGLDTDPQYQELRSLRKKYHVIYDKIRNKLSDRRQGLGRLNLESSVYQSLERSINGLTEDLHIVNTPIVQHLDATLKTFKNDTMTQSQRDTYINSYRNGIDSLKEFGLRRMGISSQEFEQLENEQLNS